MSAKGGFIGQKFSFFILITKYYFKVCKLIFWWFKFILYNFLSIQISIRGFFFLFSIVVCMYVVVNISFAQLFLS